MRSLLSALSPAQVASALSAADANSNSALTLAIASGKVAVGRRCIWGCKDEGGGRVDPRKMWLAVSRYATLCYAVLRCAMLFCAGFASAGRHQVVKLLLEFHAPVTDARDSDGNNLLHKVCWNVTRG